MDQRQRAGSEVDPPSGVQAAEEPLPAPNQGPGRYDRKKSAEERAEEHRERILRGAMFVFARDGFAQASVASILDVADVSRATFYRYFADLGEVFAAVERECAERLIETVERAVRAEPRPSEQLRVGVTAFFDLLAEHGELGRVFLREARANGRGHQELRQATLRSLISFLHDGLVEAERLGLVRRVPDDLTLRALLFAIEGTAADHLEAHAEKKLGEAVTPLLALCYRALV